MCPGGGGGRGGECSLDGSSLRDSPTTKWNLKAIRLSTKFQGEGSIEMGLEAGGVAEVRRVETAKAQQPERGEGSLEPGVPEEDRSAR